MSAWPRIETPHPFELTEHLGSGVFRGRDGVEPVWLRVLDVLADSDPAREVRRRVATLAALAHPHVAPIRGVAVTDAGQLVIVGAELLHTTTLEHLELPVRIDVLRQLAETLEELHAEGLVHGRLASASLLVAEWRGRQLVALDWVRGAHWTETPRPAEDDVEALYGLGRQLCAAHPGDGGLDALRHTLDAPPSSGRGALTALLTALYTTQQHLLDTEPLASMTWSYDMPARAATPPEPIERPLIIANPKGSFYARRPPLPPDDDDDDSDP